MICDNCKYWKPTYAPYVVHGVKYIMTCHKNKPSGETGGCRYWEAKVKTEKEKE